MCNVCGANFDDSWWEDDNKEVTDKDSWWKGGND